MAGSVEVTYQGILIAPGWHRYSDFLFKVAKPSNFGDHSWEVVDTKLANLYRLNWPRSGSGATK